jgi:pimeloyl-ACP methyl ester carboxylesterase
VSTPRAQQGIRSACEVFMPKPPIVFVHGLFVTRACWDPWIARFEARGHRCLAPAYPARELPARELRERHPDPAIAAVTLADVIDRFEGEIRGLDQPPVLIGHSFGGLLTQLLLQRQLGACGIAIDSVPPAGVLSLRWSFLRSLLPPLNPLAPASRPYLMSFRHFCYTFVNTLPPAEQRRVYDEQVSPESRRLARSGLSREARVDFARSRPPLLLIAGSRDHIIPASLNRTNWRRYERSPSVTDFREFDGRDHYLIGAPGWEEVADYSWQWAEQTLARTASLADGSGVRAGGEGAATAV